MWLGIVASVLGIPLETTATDEGSAYGAALLGGVAGGVFGDVREAAATCVRVERAIEPDVAAVVQYDRLYERFREPIRHSTRRRFPMEAKFAIVAVATPRKRP